VNCTSSCPDGSGTELRREIGDDSAVYQVVKADAAVAAEHEYEFTVWLGGQGLDSGRADARRHPAGGIGQIPSRDRPVLAAGHGDRSYQDHCASVCGPADVDLGHERTGAHVVAAQHTIGTNGHRLAPVVAHADRMDLSLWRCYYAH
jgi:hypothetical protein